MALHHTKYRKAFPEVYHRVRDLGLDSATENVIYLRADCHICRSEGFTANSRVVVEFGEASLIATLHMLQSDIVLPGEVVLSKIAMTRLGAGEGDKVHITHMRPLPSLSLMRSMMYGHTLSYPDMLAIVRDISAGRYSNIELAAFITACSGNALSQDEVIFLTRAMIETGQRLTWDVPMVLDKHCIGGLPGNRTTPIVVSIVAAAGLIIPKTSSKAITSPAGTANTMEVLTRVNLNIADIQKVVKRHGGCLAWGGAVQLSPADDLMIYIERALEVDGPAQMVASVLSKKVAAGSTHVLIDIPYGRTAKIRNLEEAIRLKDLFITVGEAVGLHVRVRMTDGSQPVGRGIGPALEALDVLQVLKNEEQAPADLRERSLVLAGELLEMGGKAEPGEGTGKARKLLDSGAAWTKFQEICKAQGKLRTPVPGQFAHAVLAEQTGVVAAIDNRKLARLAKLAGAPDDPGAGVCIHVKIGTPVVPGTELFTIYAEASGQLDYAREYMHTIPELFSIE